MALKGNLRDFSITQLLNLVNLANKTGLLRIEQNGTVASSYFKNGKLINATLTGQDSSLTAILLKAGKITDAQARTIRKRTDIKSDKELALLLMNAGHVTKEDIVKSIRGHMSGVVYFLFTWDEGDFNFEANKFPSKSVISVPMSLENVILEGTRRVKEWEQLQEELPDLDVALKFPEQRTVQLRNINLSPEEWRVISFVNPNTTIRQIAKASSMNEFQIRKIVYGMLSAGLVELVKPKSKAAPAAAPSRRSAAMKAPPPVKRGVINRLIQRIQRI